jgi:hypothetical protein
MPLFWAKKEVFVWLKTGTKTIDVRKGGPRTGSVAFFQSGPNHLELSIMKKETGLLNEVIRQDNFKLIIPTAATLRDAIDYLQRIYGSEAGVFTAYYLDQSRKQ